MQSRFSSSQTMLRLVAVAALGVAQPAAAQGAAASPETTPVAPPVAAPVSAPVAADVEFEGAYQPSDALERSLWLQMDEYERTLKSSKQVIRDPALTAYLKDVLCRTVGPECANIRLYVLRSPYFNATMAPNGVMTVWSGLLLRAQNEAQLAAVLGHEFAHFKRRHSLQLFREAKDKSNAAAWLAFTGVGLLLSIGLLDSLYEFSRDQEEQADIDGLKLISDAGYDATQVPLIWEQLLDERDATLEARGRDKEKRKTKAGMFSTHPASQARIDYLRAAITKAAQAPGSAEAERYREKMAFWWPQFLDDQLKMNDQGGSLYLIESMGKANGWSPWIAYARAEFHRRRGNAGDVDAAIGYYSAAIAQGGDLPELWRGRGFALRKAGRQDEARSDFREYLDRVPNAPDRGMVTMLVGGEQ